MSKRVKTSSVWSVFTVDKSKEQHARCDMCGLVLSFRSSISNLKKHIDRKHPTVVLQSSTSNATNPDEPSSSLPTPSTSTSTTSSSRNTSSSSTVAQSLRSMLRSSVLDSDGQSVNEESNVLVSQNPPVNRPNPRQTSLTAFIPKKMNDREKKKIDNLLLKLFTDDIQPFSIVNDSGFRAFVEALNPRYTLPSRKVITSNLIPARYEQCYNQVKAKVADAPSVSLTTDCWTSAANESYLALTAHFMSNDFELESVLLECAQIFESHTSENLARVIQRIVNDFDIHNKVILVVSDNASNIVSAVKNVLGWKHLGCYAHTLNLIAKDALNIEYVSELKEKIKTVVSHFRHSPSSNEKLIQFQKNNDVPVPLKLIQEVSTCWNSTFHMLERFVELQDAVKTSIALINRELPVLSADEWQNCQQICDVLEPLADVTKKISGEQYMVGSQLIGLTRGLISVYGKMILSTDFGTVAKELIVNIQNGLLSRFDKLEEHDIIGISSFFDPRFKLHPFTKQSASRNVKTHVTQLVTKEMNRKYRNVANPSVQEDNNQPSTNDKKKSSKYCVWDEYDTMIATKMPAGTATSSAITEIQRYLEDAVLDRKKDPLQWWREMKYMYPTLSTLALKYLNGIGTSVPCERVFSKTGNIIESLRHTLR